MARILITVATLLVVCAPSILVAQIEGRVFDDRGRGLVGVEVQLLDGGGRVLGRDRTGPTGAFDLRPVPGGSWVRASGFGFAADSSSLEDLTAPIALTLAPVPIQVEGFEVSADSAETCPSEDDGVARADWRALVSAGGWFEPDDDRNLLNDRLWVARVLEYRQAKGLGAEPPLLDDVQGDVVVTSGAAQPGLGARPFDADDVLLARPKLAGDVGGIGDRWIFAGLSGPAMPRLFSTALARDADIGFSGPSTVTLCRTDSQGVQLVATYRVAEGRVEGVVWRLSTPAPVEHAGGWAEFDVDAVRYVPLPTRAYMWHRSDAGRNWHAYSRFGPWFTGVGDAAWEKLKKSGWAPLPAP
jgi:hypothetical protein